MINDGNQSIAKKIEQKMALIMRIGCLEESAVKLFSGHIRATVLKLSVQL